MLFDYYKIKILPTKINTESTWENYGKYMLFLKISLKKWVIQKFIGIESIYVTEFTHV